MASSKRERKRIDGGGEEGKRRRRRTVLKDLPEELLCEIFTRIHPKPLSRLKSVCKPWYHLINHPSFIRMHFHASLPHKHRRLILHNEFCIYSLDPDPGQGAELIPRKIHCPFKSSEDNSFVQVFGACNGVFLISVSPPGYDWCHWFSNSNALYLWNPNNAEYMKLPQSFLDLPNPSNPNDRCERAVYGLGYDSSNHDFKVIRMLYYYDDEFLSEYQLCEYQTICTVYSLRTHSYKRIQDVPYFIFSDSRRQEYMVRGVFLNGAIHWLGNTDPRTSTHLSLRIVSFNVATEEYGEIRLPKYWKNRSRDDAFHLKIAEFSQRLCLFVDYPSHATVITMTKYGVMESWRTMYVIKKPNIPHGGLYFRPVCIFKGKLLGLWRNHNRFWYKLEHGRTEFAMHDGEYKIDGVPETFKEYFHLETCSSSLVSLKDVQGISSTTPGVLSVLVAGVAARRQKLG